jgi:hypothetical protein
MSQNADVDPIVTGQHVVVLRHLGVYPGDHAPFREEVLGVAVLTRPPTHWVRRCLALPPLHLVHVPLQLRLGLPVRHRRRHEPDLALQGAALH